MPQPKSVSNKSRGTVWRQAALTGDYYRLLENYLNFLGGPLPRNIFVQGPLQYADTEKTLGMQYPTLGMYKHDTQDAYLRSNVLLDPETLPFVLTHELGHGFAGPQNGTIADDEKAAELAASPWRWMLNFGYPIPRRDYSSFLLQPSSMGFNTLLSAGKLK